MVKAGLLLPQTYKTVDAPATNFPIIIYLFAFKTNIQYCVCVRENMYKNKNMIDCMVLYYYAICYTHFPSSIQYVCM